MIEIEKINLDFSSQEEGKSIVPTIIRFSDNLKIGISFYKNKNTITLFNIKTEKQFILNKETIDLSDLKNIEILPYVYRYNENHYKRYLIMLVFDNKLSFYDPTEINNPTEGIEPLFFFKLHDSDKEIIDTIYISRLKWIIFSCKNKRNKEYNIEYLNLESVINKLNGINDSVEYETGSIINSNYDPIYIKKGSLRYVANSSMDFLVFYDFNHKKVGIVFLEMFLVNEALNEDSYDEFLKIYLEPTNYINNAIINYDLSKKNPDKIIALSQDGTGLLINNISDAFNKMTDSSDLHLNYDEENDPTDIVFKESIFDEGNIIKISDLNIIKDHARLTKSGNIFISKNNIIFSITSKRIWAFKLNDDNTKVIDNHYIDHNISKIDHIVRISDNKVYVKDINEHINIYTIR